ncbi:MAG: methionyl-tRNA formyltransferase [Chitinophagales bacterium]|nr:methionyl-tRNA formyltransferase [Chitinophagales bacterium]MBP8754451.1 methionyl-tRNA formyltransferase [Chitinophagales bacterium]
MGTPQFAVSSLEKLIHEGFDIAAVITAPDKPAGRGLVSTESPVKKCAIQHGIKILQPTNLKAQSFIDELKQLRADLFVVVAFRMLPEIVWDMPELGTINLHASLLPDYRGAAPINHAILNGETETGLTTFFLKKEIDTGDILFTKPIEILPDDNAGSLHDKMMLAGAELLFKTVKVIESRSFNTMPQHKNSNKTAPKIFKEDCKIDWNNSSQTIYNFIRGLSPYPTAWTILEDKTLKIFSGKIIFDKTSQSPGNYITDGKQYLRFATADGLIDITELQLEGKKKMSVTDFLKGYRFNK